MRRILFRLRADLIAAAGAHFDADGIRVAAGLVLIGICADMPCTILQLDRLHNMRIIRKEMC